MVRAELGGWKEVGKRGSGRVRGRNGPASKLGPSRSVPFRDPQIQLIRLHAGGGGDS